MIVLGYDGSDDAQRAIAAASEVMSGRALVVHVWEPVPRGAAPAVASPGVAGAGMPMLAEAAHQIEERAKELLDDGTRRAIEAGFEAEPVFVEATGGGTWRNILDVVEARDARVIVVGRRGLSRLRSVLLGSVSNGLVQHAHVPVLIVPPPARSAMP